jgi:hypothetical protein
MMLAEIIRSSKEGQGVVPAQAGTRFRFCVNATCGATLLERFVFAGFLIF